MNLLISPYVFTNIEGVLRYNNTESLCFMIALPGARRWKELSSFTPSHRSPNSELSRLFVGEGLFPGERERLERSLRSPYAGELEDFGSLFSLVGHSLAKCPTPLHS